MDQLDHNLLNAWMRVFERCKADPVEARRRYERALPGTVVDRPVRAWCVALRASDLRLNDCEGVVQLGAVDQDVLCGEEIVSLEDWLNAEDEDGEEVVCEAGGFDPVRAQLAHEIEVDAYTLSELGGPVWIPYPGVPLTEAARLLGRNYAGMRGWLPVGAGRSRVERDALAARGRTYDGRLIWATFEKRGYPLKVRYEPPSCHGRRGREVPVVWSDHALDPGAAKGRPPAWWWGSMWQGLADGIGEEFEQGLVRVPKFLPCKGEMRFRGWLWRCPGLSGQGGCGRLVPKLFAPLPVWTVGRYYGIKEGLDVAGLAGQWFPGVMDRWAGRRSLACWRCWRVRNGGSAERHGWNEFVTHLSGGLLYGHEVEKPADFAYERRRAYVKRVSKRDNRQRGRQGSREAAPGGTHQAEQSAASAANACPHSRMKQGADSHRQAQPTLGDQPGHLPPSRRCFAVQ